MGLATVQRQVRQWLANQPFGPNQESWEPLLGIIEELGELCRAHLKAHQKIRGTPEEHRAKAKDSVGDMVIFLAGFCDAIGADLHICRIDAITTIATTTKPHAQLLQIAHSVGKLAHPHLNNLTYVSLVIGEVLIHLERYCDICNFRLDECIDEALAEVMQRDWSKHPTKGRP